MLNGSAILILIDGCRPDALHPERTPNLMALAGQGAWSYRAQTVMPAITLPCHFSLFTSQAAETHGVWKNTLPEGHREAFGLIDYVRQAGGRAAAFYNWHMLYSLFRPDSVHRALYMDNAEQLDGDLEIAAAAADYITGAQPHLAFVYLGTVDACGHRHGWMSPEYLEQVARADRAVGHLLAALSAAGLRERYTVVVLSDHGGHGMGHGEPIPDDLTIPWIAAGRGIRARGEIAAPVSILDTAPTLAALLGLDALPLWEGKRLGHLLG